jgi:hypothetical protein
MKLTIVLAAVFGYLLLTFACATSSSRQTTALLNNSAPPPATAPAAPDGTTPPHAVDTDGKALPDESTTEPTKGIILAKDSVDPKNGEVKKEQAFDHVKHSTDPSYSVDGKTVTGCAECHHTDQPKAPAGQDYLKTFKRTEMLTSEQLKKSNQPVKSCRVCHYQQGAEGMDDVPDSITYPKGSGKESTKDKILNDEAYHLNCNTCHAQALKDKTRAKPPKAPQACADCHTQKKS